MIDILKKYWWVVLLAAIAAYWYFSNRKADPTATNANAGVKPDGTKIVLDAADGTIPAIAEGEPVPGGIMGSNNNTTAAATNISTTADQLATPFTIKA